MAATGASRQLAEFPRHAAELLNVGKRSVQRARHVLDCAAPNLVRVVECGQLKLGDAHRDWLSQQLHLTGEPVVAVGVVAIAAGIYRPPSHTEVERMKLSARNQIKGKIV